MAVAQSRITGSLPVANVQALAEAVSGGVGHQPQPVPEIYLHKDPISEELAADDDDSTRAVPVIDFRKLLDPRSSEEECAKLASACLDWGIFQVINHGLPEEVTGNLMNDVVGFLKQPLEDKKECSQRADSLEGYGQAFVVSEDQKLDWGDMLYVHIHPTESRDLRFWPTRPASFRHSIDVYCSESRELAYRLLEFMAKSVGAEPASLRGLFEGQVQAMRVNYYPPCPPAADRVMGFSPHTDICGLTLLLQMSPDVQGLQLNKDGKWLSVPYIDGALVVNVGDTLEILSNGRFTSVEHRAVVHPTKERMSVALFHYPRQDKVIGPLPEFVKGDRLRYASTDFPEFLKQYFAAKLDGRRHLETLKLEQ